MTATLDIDAIVAKAATIPGWMHESELRYLAEQAAQHTSILEVGSFQGRSTKALALATSGTVYCCDDWRGEESTPVDPSRLRTLFAQHLAPEIISGKVITLHMNSEVLAWMLEHDWLALENSFGLIFIDGDHSAEAVRRDIKRLRPYLRPGGLLCGHDGYLPGVKQAINDWLPGARIVVHSIWEWRAP